MKKLHLFLAITFWAIFSSCSKQDASSTNNEENININSPLIGQWSSSGTSFASYINSAGQYIGDASISDNHIYKFNSNGTYESLYAFTTGFRTDTYFYKGKFTINNNQFTTTPNFYEHKRNTELLPNNDPNNMKQITTTFSIADDIDTQRKFVEFDYETGGNWAKLFKAE